MEQESVIMGLYEKMSAIEFKEYFKEGFSKGIKIMTEVFCKEK